VHYEYPRRRFLAPKVSKSHRFYFNRTFGRHCHYFNTGVDFISGLCTGTRKRAARLVYQQYEADCARLVNVRAGLRWKIGAIWKYHDFSVSICEKQAGLYLPFFEFAQYSELQSPNELLRDGIWHAGNLLECRQG